MVKATSWMTNIRYMVVGDLELKLPILAINPPPGSLSKLHIPPTKTNYLTPQFFTDTVTYTHFEKTPEML